MELLRFYSSKELRLLAKAADARLHLPPDFQLSYELLRGMEHEHVRLRQVQGEWIEALKGCCLVCWFAGWVVLWCAAAEGLGA